MRDLTDELSRHHPVPVVDITNRQRSEHCRQRGHPGHAGDRSVGTRDFSAWRARRENGAMCSDCASSILPRARICIAPAVIEAAVKSSYKDAVDRTVALRSEAGNQRPALVLANGSVVIAWASHEDIEPYHGWVMAYDAATLKPNGVFCVTPEGTRWRHLAIRTRPGRGRRSASIYFEVGNGDWDGVATSARRCCSSSCGQGARVGGLLHAARLRALNDRDADIGSTGPLLVPGTNRIIAGSKKGIFYVLDGHNLGHMTPDDHGLIQLLATTGGRALPGPAFWVSPSGPHDVSMERERFCARLPY